MYGWAETALVKARLRTAPAVVDEEPEEDPAITALREQLAQVTGEVGSLRTTVTRMQRVEARSVRRLFLLAKNVAKIVKANNVTSGEPVGNDSVLFVLSNDDGKWLEMVVYPYKETFVLRDARGVLSDQTFRLDSELGDLPRETILMLAGYAEFATRNAADDSDSYWSQTANAELALTDESVAA